MATGSTDAWNRGIFLILKKLFHLVSAVHFWYGIYYNLRHVYPAKGHPFYGIMPNQIIGKFGFLTILGAVCITFQSESQLSTMFFFYYFIV